MSPQRTYSETLHRIFPLDYDLINSIRNYPLLNADTFHTAMTKFCYIPGKIHKSTIISLTFGF